MNFSVVMAVYKNDKPEWLVQAIDSLLDQTVKSDNIIIVRDGKVSKELEETLRGYEQKRLATVIRLGKNVGAGQARNKGVKVARNQYIAIMDADDISLPNRFELQIEYLLRNPDTALVGGQLAEFEGDTENITGYRNVPTDYGEIRKFARYRSPINHMTIMFDRENFFEVGGYPAMTRAEDYYMVSALLAKGFVVGNLKETTVLYRVDRDNMNRRKSWSNVRENIVSRWKIYRLGTSSLVSFTISSMGQIALLILPTTATASLFKAMLRGRAK